MLPPAGLYELLTHFYTGMAELDATAARNQPYAPQGTNDVDAILKRDDADESLQRYKAQLLGAAAQGDRGDVSDPQKPLWKSSSELGCSTPSSRRGHGDNVASMACDSRAEVRMACSILDLSWRTCERARDGAANASTHLTVSDAANAPCRPR